MSARGLAVAAVRGPLASATVPAGALQRACACGTHTGGRATCSGCGGDERIVQRSAARADTPAYAPPNVHDVLRSPGEPLAPSARAWFETRLGHDFTGVRVHADSPAAESAHAVGALAYTVGPHVVFGAGRYAPHSPAGRRLLAHELAHVVQQRGTGTAAIDRLRIGDRHDSAEAEADAIAERVGSTARVVPIAPTTLSHVVQRTCGDALGTPSPACERGTADASGAVFHFEVSCDDLKPGEYQRLVDLASHLQPDDAVIVHGYASEEGSGPFNWDLSCHRAKRIKQMLGTVAPRVPVRKTVMHGPRRGAPREYWRNVVIEVVGATPAPRGAAPKSLTIVSWINAEGLPDFSSVAIGNTRPVELRAIRAVAMALKCTSNPRPPADVRGTRLEALRNSKEYRAIQHYVIGPTQPPLQLVGFTAPSRCSEIPLNAYQQGEASPLNRVRVGATDFDALMKFRVSAEEEAAALDALPWPPVGLGGLRPSVMPRVPWVWTSSDGRLTSDRRLQWFVRPSAFPTHTIYVDGRQVAEIPQQEASVLVGPNVRTADRPRQSPAEEEAQRHVPIADQQETVREGRSAHGEN